MVLKSCEIEGISVPEFETDFEGRIIMIGAGAAGMAAGYLLIRMNIDFLILEAAETPEGWMRRNSTLADFPVDLGAEWIHAEPSVLSDILDDLSLDTNVDLITYNPQTFEIYHKGKLKKYNYGSNFYREYKFKSTTWFGFFEQYVLPSIGNKLVLNTPVTAINGEDEQVQIATASGQTYQADKVLITASIKVPQDNIIQLTPALLRQKGAAINNIYMGDGLKAFIVFTERCYPDILLFGKLLDVFAAEDKTFYDGSFRKDSDMHVLGLFSINDQATAYTSLGFDQAIITAILNELDEIFNGRASSHYVDQVMQNWSAEPYIRGAYSYDFFQNQQDSVDAISELLGNQVYFAGEALSIDNQATVHGACKSAYAAIEHMLKE